MADTPNYANSPLANPNFLNNLDQPAAPVDYSKSKLANPDFLAEAVAQEVRRPAPTAAEELRALEAEKANLRSRDANEFIGDQVTGAGSAFVGLVGGAIGLGISGVGALSQYAGEDGGALDEFGQAASDYAVDYAQTTNRVTDFIRSGQSDTKAENARINAEMSAIQAAQNEAEYERAIAEGENSFIAGLTRVGKDALDTTARVLSDPLATESVVVDALGSLGPSARFARAGVELASGIATRMGVREGSGLAAAEVVGSALATGAIEGSGTYSQTVGEVMARTPEEMMTSPLYRDLLAQGMDPVEAQKQVADTAGMEAFRINLPAAIAAGVISAKFNANPVAAFEGKAMVEGLAEVGGQALEEMAQGGASQIAQNLAMGEIVDDTIRVSDDVGEQLALGAIGGAGMAGALGAAPTVINAIDQYEQRAQDDRDYNRFVRDMGDQIAQQRRAEARANMTPEEREADVRSAFRASSPADDLFNSVVNRGAEVLNTVRETAQGLASSEGVSGAVDTVKAGVAAAREAATPIVNQVIKSAQNFVDKPNPEIQNETVAAAESVSVAAADPAVETGTLGVPDPTIKKESLPEIFKDSVAEGSSIADTMTNIVKTIAEKKVPISEMKDDAILFVAQKFNEMQNAASTLAPEVQNQIKKVLASPDLERIRKRAARLDLNTAVSSTIEKVSSTVKAMTVAMSKLNPTNVNPDVVDKILKEEDTDMSPEELRTMEIAASVARPLNSYKENIVKIADEKYQALVASGEKPAKPETNVDQVSRNLIVGNLTGENKVPSINETANRIIIGMQSPDQAVDIDGVRVPVKEVAGNFRKLVQHMVNKVNALNESFDQNDERGVGPAVTHDTLVRGKDFIKAGMAGSKSVTYNKRSVNSVTFAKTVGADAAVLGEVYNALVAAYPDQFPDGPVTIPVIKTPEAAETAAQTTAVTDQSAASETASVSDQNTTADEEVTAVAGTDEAEETTPTSQPPATTDDEASPDAEEAANTDRKPTDEEKSLIIRTLEKAYAGFQIPDLKVWIRDFNNKKLNGFHQGGEMKNGVMALSPSIMQRIMANPTEKNLHIIRHEFGHFIDFDGEYPVSDSRDWEKAVAEFDLFVDTKATETQKKFLAYILSYRGQDGYPKEVFADLFAIMGAKPKFVQDNMPTAFRIMQEAMGKSLEAVNLDTDGILRDDDGNVIKFYHGTGGAEFDQFNDSKDGIFLTTRKGQGREFAIGKENPRLIEVQVRATNPLFVETEGDMTPQDMWLSRRSRLEADYKAGNHDAIIIAQGTEAIVVVYKGDQIDILNQNVDAKPAPKAPAPTQIGKISDRFTSVFRAKKSAPKAENAQQILDIIGQKEGNAVYVEFAEVLMGMIRNGMNARLQSVLVSKSDGRSLAQGLKEDQASILEIRDFKPLMIVDPDTGVYDQKLLDLASMAVIDWLTTARPYGGDRLDDTLKELDLKADDLTQEQFQDILNSVPPRSVTESLAKKIMKLWNVQGINQAQMVDIRGTTEGLVKEIITVLSQMEDPLVRVIDIKVGKGSATTFDVSALKPEQEAIGLAATGSLDKIMFPEDAIMASFGEPIAFVPKSQDSKPDVPLTAMEQRAIKRMQDTPHTEAKPVVEFFKALGVDAWATMAGRRDSSQLAPRHPLRLTIEGKNSSIERDYETAIQMVDAAAGRPVFYPVGVTNVGRHQMKGINPQNNKLLRGMLTPTHSKLDMVNNQMHKDAFWLTVAQSSGLAKVEKKDHKLILSTIQNDYNVKFGEATAIALAFYENGSLDQEAFTQAMLKATKGEDVSMAQTTAVLAVARLQLAQKNGTAETFETSLSFELDGKTDGPANMMVAFGQGLMTRDEFMNFKRVGLFLGSKSETLNTFLSGNQDLYEVNSVFSTKRMVQMIDKASGLDKKRLMALQRFAAHFGDFEVKPDGSIVMSRATSKNPMTKKVYGSGENGIAEGISQDMLVGFYTQLVNLPDGASVEDHLNYAEINQDLDLLFGMKLPEKLDVNKFILPSSSMAPFSEFVKSTIGVVLSNSIEEVMDLKTIGVNNLLVYTTNVQGEFMKLLFEQRLAEAVDEAAKEWEADGKPSKFALRKLSQEKYDEVVKEVLAFAPYFKDGNQNLRIGDFTGQQDKTEMSSNLNGNIRAKSTMAKPDDIGVKGIPYVIQGRGDAMMMNRIFSAENAPERAIPIFDGIDMAITDFMGLSNQINEAVLDNWDNDVIGPIVDNFENFVELAKRTGNEKRLEVAFDIVKALTSAKTSVSAQGVQDLQDSLAEAQRLSQARKAVFKQITLSVDHMGGSGQAYVRNSDGKELTFEEINSMIQDQMDGKTGSNDPVISETPAVEVTPPVVTEDPNLVVTDVDTVLKALLKETKKAHLRDVLRAIGPMLPKDSRIVMGTPESIKKWRAENLNQNRPQKLDQKANGYYDIDNGIIFILSDKPETIVHEMIHLATFQTVLDHYNGVKKTSAVKNLEVLMEEFLSMDMEGMPPRAYASAKRAILEGKAKGTPFGDAMALNEFMAWTLASDSLMKALKTKPTSLVARLTKVAKAWIQRMLGVVPQDMYSNILFNTQILLNDEFGGLDTLNTGGGDTGRSATGEVTPPADNFTNFWIDLLRERLNDAQDLKGLDQVDVTRKRQIQQKLGKYYGNADDALKRLDFGGFALSEYQKKTFIAIHTVIATELRLDTNALLALGRMYEHITNNLTPAMFGKGQAAQDRYSTVMELMGATTNDEGISDAVAVLLALSQTSTGFRNALEQIPQPAAQPGIQTTSLNDILTSTTGFLMQKLVASTDTEGKGVKEILDALSDQILRQDDQNEFKALKGLMGTFDKADSFLGGAMSSLAQRTREANRAVQASDQNAIVKTVMGGVTLATSFLDADLSKQSAKAAKNATHMGGILDSAVFIREMVTEIVGADETNTDVIRMLDEVNYVVQSSRQAYREELPVLLQNEFQNHPDKDQWKALHHVLGKADFGALFDLGDPDASFDLMNDQNLLNQRIQSMEKKIQKEFPGQMGANILLKSQQLADFMNGKGAGFQLFKNAYAIHKLVGGKKPFMVPEIDKLISLYALNGTDVAEREAVAKMQAVDPKGVHNLIVYMQALNKEEDQKVVSEAARMNGYKGYIPDYAKGEISLIIAKDSEREALERRGYTRVGDDTSESGTSLISRGYYMSTTKQGGNYSQGVLQQVQDTYKGVNATTGLTVNGTVSGVISGVAVVSITNAMNQSMQATDPKNVLIPVYDESGDILYYERGLNPDMMEKHFQPDSNMALMLGAWAGRQVEEKFSHEYNKALVAKLKKIWDEREQGSEGLFVRMDQAKDKIYAESWEVIPPQLKEHILATFGEDTGFMVKKDMINLSLGYRDPSIVDVWTGNNRLPEAVELAVKVVSKGLMGDKGYKWLANAETVTMNTISTAKDVIVVRSLVVPFMNTQSNVMQLVNRGVGTKQIMKGYKEKFVEIDKLNENLKTIMGLKAQKLLNATDKNRVMILDQQIKTLEDENKRFSVAPLVEAGLYKTISEGMTELDVSITDGKFGDWVENKLNSLPAGVQTVAKYGLLSKDTALYRGANKAVQYGDFIAKSIYYDALVEKGLTPVQAMAKVNEEFVNFSLLPGRTRTYLESMGATWFLTFKIRSMKVALQMMRENPARAMTGIYALGLDTGPVTDNVLGKLAEGTLPYSLGWDMLWDAPGMNPWVELFNG